MRFNKIFLANRKRQRKIKKRDTCRINVTNFRARFNEIPYPLLTRDIEYWTSETLLYIANGLNNIVDAGFARGKNQEPRTLDKLLKKKEKKKAETRQKKIAGVSRKMINHLIYHDINR